jgi:hypothetical protein
VKSAHFVWTIAMTRTKGSISKITPPLLKEPGISPPSDHSFTSHRELTFDLTKLAYSYTSQQWKESQKEYVDTKSQFVHNGTIYATFRPKSFSDFPIGYVKRNCIHGEVTTMHVRPVLMAYRASDSSLSPYREGMFRVTGKRAMIGGRWCWEMRVPSTGLQTSFLWVDPGNGFVAKRFSVLHNKTNGIVWNMDVQYESHNVAEWLPVRWDAIENHVDGTLLLSAKAEMRSHEFNPVLPDSTFEIDFPPGTYVIDQDTGSHYIQLEDSRLRAISRSEITKPYQELLKSSSPDQHRRNWTWRVLAPVGVLGVAMARIAVYRSRKSRRGVATV